MKKNFLSIYICIAVLAAGCAESLTLSPTPEIIPTSIDSSTPPYTAEIESTLTPVHVISDSENAHITNRCLDVSVSSRMGGTTASGVIVLRSKDDSQVALHNMLTDQIMSIARQNENQTNFVISPNKRLLAYQGVTVDEEGNILKRNFVILTADGKVINEVPVEKNWLEMIGWSTDESLIISVKPKENAAENLVDILVLNVLNGEREILHSSFPGLLDMSALDIPYWEGWSGVVYNSNFTRAIYPKYLGSDNKSYTYALWDVVNQKLITTLENEFTAFTSFSDKFPMPHWSPDGTQFVFRGLVFVSNDLVEFELYKVAQNGTIERLTQLTSSFLVQDSNLSWAPNGDHITIFMNPWGTSIWESDATVAVLDLASREIVNYCVPVSGKGNPDGLPSPAIWSPKGTQFLITDWDDNNVNRNILVDIENNFAVEVGNGMIPIAWMELP